MIITDYIIESQIIFTDTLTSKKDIFMTIAETAKINGITASKETIVKKLEQREQMGSTALLDGFAIPHAKDSTFSMAMVIIIISKHPIPWENLNRMDARFIISLLFPLIDRQALQIKFLSEISTILIDTNFIDKIKEAKSPSEIKMLFN